MSPHVLAILLFSISLGTIITISSSHWLFAWMGLEMSTLAIIPVMAQSHSPRAIEATMKYFITQAIAAALLLFSGVTNAWLTGHWDISFMGHNSTTMMFTLALALKIGLAPAHLWLPEVLQGLDLTTGIILSTWQKLAPFALLVQIQPLNPDMLISLGLLSTLIGGWGGLNQTQLRKILAYSSIAHLGWMALVLQFSPALTLITLLTYIVMTSSTFLIFKFNKSLSINTLATSWTKAPALTAFVPLVLLSLGGLPPLTGFLPKWMILQELTKQSLSLLATIAALTALLSLFFYLRLSYAMTLTMSPSNLNAVTSWRVYSTQLSLPLSTTTIAATCLLPLTPGVMTLALLW
uniref:NADH-ubiquinone oxidoreductase chain 2 n=1 Tax=Centropristis striata TaxID=184440 RepID=A0A5J6BUU9_CENSR|nr:NADH dehydrogenase subunit 2 [Centropristis striata]QEP94854.1 NADH dehydrogenase subunit 2 [Centropristis striata]WMY90501.1 NADH dehydrogenase subunit 2 [Centropristis striata]